jgi:hypothetical protein
MMHPQTGLCTCGKGHLHDEWCRTPKAHDVLITVTAEGVELQVIDHDDQSIIVEANDLASADEAWSIYRRWIGRPETDQDDR